MNIHWKDWCCSWNSNALATWCKELMNWKILWCWERLGQEMKGMMANELVRWHHYLNAHEFEQAPELVMTKNPGVLQAMGYQRIRHGWVSELNWSETNRDGYIALSSNNRLLCDFLSSQSFHDVAWSTREPRIWFHKPVHCRCPLSQSYPLMGSCTNSRTTSSLQPETLGPSSANQLAGITPGLPQLLACC